VVRDTHVLSVVEKLPSYELYAPLGNPYAYPTPTLLLARTRAAGGEEAIRSTLRSLFPTADRVVLTSLDDVVDRQMQPWTTGAVLFGAFGLLALIVATLGIYSAVAYSVSQRTREIATRAAIGASRGRLIRAVLTSGLAPVLIGAAAGIAPCLAMARAVAASLYEVSPYDPPLLASCLGVLLAAGALACLVPARRALAIDPIEAIRT
jgi:ABC-type antimicrobial peptide transport system permease subunit